MKFLLGLAAMLSLSGCAGYVIGPIKPTPMRNIKSLAVNTFKNETLEPRIEVLVTDTVIKQIQQDGTYAVAREGQADAILEGKITHIYRNSARSVQGNIFATREFNLEVDIDYKVTRRGTGEVLASRTVYGTTSFFVGRDVESDQRQAIPLAAQDAAVAIVSQISEGW